MGTHTVGILHPGAMGIFIAASLQQGNHLVYWVSDGRSEHTRQRAEAFNLEDAGTLAHLCEASDVIISVCPPEAAVEVAEQVVGQSFRGLYVDANAISPQRALEIGSRMAQAGIAFVDGGIIGGPAWHTGETRLYLSGKRAAEAAALFTAGRVVTSLVGEEIGQASALKICYAAYTKGTTALLCAILAAAEELGVRAELEGEWSRNGSNFAAETQDRVRRVTAKAWRFVGEMEEIAATFQAAGLPGEFHLGAGQVYRRLAQYKDSPSRPALEEALRALIEDV